MIHNGERFRPSAAGPDGSHSLASVAKDAAADLLDLVGAQIRLVRAELSAEVRASASRLARVAVFAPVVIIGYAFGMAAAAAALAPIWGWPLALLALAGLQLVVGTAGVLWALRRLTQVRLLHRTADEVAETVRRIEATARPANGRGHGTEEHG
jgi:uncharacterized membrane protein YqjE